LKVSVLRKGAGGKVKRRKWRSAKGERGMYI
jgi:hypothetical protein